MGKRAKNRQSYRPWKFQVFWLDFILKVTGWPIRTLSTTFRLDTKLRNRQPFCHRQSFIVDGGVVVDSHACTANKRFILDQKSLEESTGNGFAWIWVKIWQPPDASFGCYGDGATKSAWEIGFDDEALTDNLHFSINAPPAEHCFLTLKICCQSC